MTQQEERKRGRDDSSFFWPVLLIGIGVVALLVNTGRLPGDNLWGLLSLWPLLLVLAGLDLIFARRLPALGGLMGLALVAVVVWLMLTGRVPASPAEALTIGGLHINTSPRQVVRDAYSEPLGGAERAVIELSLQQFDTEIDGLQRDSANLFEASVDHVGEVRFDVSGGATRSIALSASGPSLSIGTAASGRRWQVGLAQGVPLELSISMGSGDLAMDLGTTTLEKLSLRGGSGDVDAVLPAGVDDLSYQGGSGQVTLDAAPRTQGAFGLSMGSGDVQLRVGADADLDVTLRQGGSGDVLLYVPSGTPLQVTVKSAGSGRVRVPRDVGSVEDGRRWQSTGYAEAERRVTVVAERMGSGDLIVSYR